MKTVKVTLVLLTILIVVVPIATVLYLYRDNLPGLVITPQITNLLSGNVTSQFQQPSVAGTPQYNASSGNFAVSFNFTNPLSVPATIDQITAQDYCQEHNFPLGNMSNTEPINVGAGQTAIITVSGNFTQEAIARIQSQHAGESSMKVKLENVNVNIEGVTLHVDEVPNAGSIPLTGQT